ncbi:hypothetical protein AA0112_g12700 [Alternaria arborescens]|nr:hypothetical protein AA0112_g12700 [Alternaria arborescens]
MPALRAEIQTKSFYHAPQALSLYLASEAQPHRLRSASKRHRYDEINS